MVEEHFYRCPKLPWMIDFHSGAEGKVLNSQLKAAFESNRINHLSELNFHSETPRQRLTGIMCTIGPSCTSAEILEKMMASGMTAVRIKMTYYSHEECVKVINTIRQANDNYSKSIGRIYPLPIALEIKGPEIRTGFLKDVETTKIHLAEGNTTYLTTDPAYEEHVTENMIFVDYQKINEIIEPGDQIYIESDNVRLTTLEIVGEVVKCVVEKAGYVTSCAKLSIPGAPIDLPAISQKDTEDINFGVLQNVDIIIVSNTKNAKTVETVKEVLGEAHQHIMIISKIENCEGLENFNEILDISDGIMFSRNYLSVEMPYEKIFLAQKSVLAKCYKFGKPVINGSIMLGSMTHSSQPNRSETCDVANAVLDGSDCLTLSKETAVGKYVTETIDTLVSICKEAEAAVYQKQLFQDLSDDVLSPIEPIQAISVAAVMAALKCNAAAIILCTTSGRTAKIISQYKPRCPIIAITRYAGVARQLHIFRGVDPILYLCPVKEGCWNKDVDNRIQLGITYGKVSGFIRTGDALVILNGSRPGSGFTNSMKIVYASAFDALPPKDVQKEVKPFCKKEISKKKKSFTK